LSTLTESGTLKFMLQANQIRAGRALLAWRQQDLAKAAKIGLATIARIEQQEGPAQGNVSTIIRIQEALERAGVRFTEDDGANYGVRLEKKPPRR
jgi:predicted transcriptional regulator